jgi:maleate isomerase
MAASYRSKGCIGYIVPPRCNETVIEEALAIRPPGLSWCFASLGMPEFGQTNFLEALEVVEEAASQLAERKVDMIVYSGVPLTATQGEDYHKLLETRLRNRVGGRIPVVTDSTLVLQALQLLQVNRVSLITPYRTATVERLSTLFQAKGHHVVDATGLGLSLGQLLTDAEDDSAFDAALDSFAKHPDTDGFYLSCPQWPVVGAIERLEEATGKPVVTQLQAVLWWAMHVLGLHGDEPVPGLGRLFLETEAPADLLAVP